MENSMENYHSDLGSEILGVKGLSLNHKVDRKTEEYGL